MDWDWAVEAHDIDYSDIGHVWPCKVPFFNGFIPNVQFLILTEAN
jgi:hypothetical protein